MQVQYMHECLLNGHLDVTALAMSAGVRYLELTCKTHFQVIAIMSNDGP